MANKPFRVDEGEFIWRAWEILARSLASGYPDPNPSDSIRVTNINDPADILGAVRFVDENGIAYGVKQVSNRPRVSSTPYTYDIAKGNVTGHYPIRQDGFNGDVGASWETVYHAGGLRQYLAVAERLQVASDDGDDDGAPAGNGARTVRIDGLDGNYDAISETVTMNGVANVLTDASFLRVLITTTSILFNTVS